MSEIPKNLRIIVDADSCPVKSEIYKVALRHGVPVVIVANSFFPVPRNKLVTQVIVGADFDAADNYIADESDAKTVVITSDILLADRCLKAGATVLASNGKLFTPNSIGMAVADRNLAESLRGGAEQLGGPPPFSKTDRSRFLSALHDALMRLKRE